jgi:hypothetical protein
VQQPQQQQVAPPPQQQQQFGPPNPQGAGFGPIPVVTSDDDSLPF